MENKIENLQKQVLLLSNTLRDVMYTYADDYLTEGQKKEYIRSGLYNLENLMQSLWSEDSNENN